MTYIYGLKDPRDGKVYYIGKSDNPRARLACHLCDGTNPKKVTWLDGLFALGLRPELVILEELGGDGDWRAVEQRWISDGLDRGWPLINMIDGGDGGDGAFVKSLLDGEQWFELLTDLRTEEQSLGSMLDDLLDSSQIAMVGKDDG